MDCSTCKKYEAAIADLNEYGSYLNYSKYYATCIAVLNSVGFITEEYAKHKVNEVHPTKAYANKSHTAANI